MPRRRSKRRSRNRRRNKNNCSPKNNGKGPNCALCEDNCVSRSNVTDTAQLCDNDSELFVDCEAARSKSDTDLSSYQQYTSLLELAQLFQIEEKKEEQVWFDKENEKMEKNMLNEEQQRKTWSVTSVYQKRNMENSVEDGVHVAKKMKSCESSLTNRSFETPKSTRSSLEEVVGKRPRRFSSNINLPDTVGQPLKKMKDTDSFPVQLYGNETFGKDSSDFFIYAEDSSIFQSIPSPSRCTSQTCKDYLNYLMRDSLKGESTTVSLSCQLVREPLSPEPTFRSTPIIRGQEESDLYLTPLGSKCLLRDDSDTDPEIRITELCRPVSKEKHNHESQEKFDYFEEDDLFESVASLLNKSLDEEYRECYLKKLIEGLSKISVTRIVQVLSILPLEKILELICFSFSIPVLESISVSISVTKVVNILATFLPYSYVCDYVQSHTRRSWSYVTYHWSCFASWYSDFKTRLFSRRVQRACNCDNQKIADLEKRIKNLENEITKYQYFDGEIQRLKDVAKSLEDMNRAQGPVLSGVPRPPPAPPIPPPPPPPLPPPPIFQTPKPLLIQKKPKADTTGGNGRLAITVEDLQKVTLRKVTKPLQKMKTEAKGPVVSLEMLRSVKLRSCNRKRSTSRTSSPTRAQNSRDRNCRIKSPSVRSTSRSTDRKTRYSGIPMSKILQMEETLDVKSCHEMSLHSLVKNT